MSVRVRFAPSPTGSLHLGNALTAVANRRFADEHGGALVLRIDDTDPTRTIEGGEQAILADLEWLGIAWDEGPVRQSVRAGLYAAAAEAAERDGAAQRDADGSLRIDGDAAETGRQRHLSARDRGRRPRPRHHARHPRLGSPAQRGTAAPHRAGSSAESFRR